MLPGSTAAMSDLAAAGMFLPPSTTGTVRCCICGDPIPPNPANMCPRCLRSRVDITDGLPRHAAAIHCPDCLSYLHPPRTWIRADLESKELLSFLLRHLKSPLSRLRLRLVGADFVWTEPHSKRIKLKLRVQQETLNSAVLEQSHIVEFTIHDRLCDSCSRSQASPDQWAAAVQLRQNVAHRRTFFYIEQLVLRHGAAARAIRIRESERGLDFFFSSRSHAVRFVEFIAAVAPVKSRSDKQLVSHDAKSNISNYKNTFSVEISPICREDLVCLSKENSSDLKIHGPLVVCTKVSSSIVLVNPLTLDRSFIDAKQYWRTPFRSLLSSRQLVEYIVLDIGTVASEVTIAGSRYALADAEVARVSDFGKNDNIFHIKTHLGHLLNPGDYALGYDLFGANTNDDEFEKCRHLLPAVILIKKSYEEKRERKRGKARPWKLKSLDVEVDGTARGLRVDEEKRNVEYEEFLRDLEENPELRFNISLYRNKEYQPSEIASSVGGDDAPAVPLDELLADLELSDGDEDDDADSMAE